MTALTARRRDTLGVIERNLDMDMTEIAKRVARALGKRNLLRPKANLESVAEVIDEVACIPLMQDVLANMGGGEVIERASSEAAKRAGTF